MSASNPSANRPQDQDRTECASWRAVKDGSSAVRLEERSGKRRQGPQASLCESEQQDVYGNAKNGISICPATAGRFSGETSANVFPSVHHRCSSITKKIDEEVSLKRMSSLPASTIVKVHEFLCNRHTHTHTQLTHNSRFPIIHSDKVDFRELPATTSLRVKDKAWTAWGGDRAGRLASQDRKHFPQSSACSLGVGYNPTTISVRLLLLGWHPPQSSEKGC